MMRNGSPDWINVALAPQRPPHVAHVWTDETDAVGPDDFIFAGDSEIERELLLL
jgi:hypothetical protein